jgi:hypothetical protein
MTEGKAKEENEHKAVSRRKWNRLYLFVLLFQLVFLLFAYFFSKYFS